MTAMPYGHGRSAGAEYPYPWPLQHPPDLVTMLAEALAMSALVPTTTMYGPRIGMEHTYTSVNM